MEPPHDDAAGTPAPVPLDGVLDLHMFQPRDVKDLVPDYIDACLEAGVCELRIIHGKGTGVLRTIVHGILDRHPAVREYRLAGHDGGSWGATLVWLRHANDRADGAGKG